MIIELSAEELEIIAGWYSAAAGESMSGISNPLTQSLLAKLAIPIDHHDKYDLEHPHS